MMPTDTNPPNLRGDFLAQLLAGLITALLAAWSYAALATHWQPVAAWIAILATTGTAHLWWLRQRRRETRAVSLLLIPAGGALWLAGAAPPLATLVLATLYGLLRYRFLAENARTRRSVLGLLGCALALAAAGWLGSWSAGGLGLGCWTWLLVLACTDLCRGREGDGTRQDAFSKAAQALERSLGGI